MDEWHLIPGFPDYEINADGAVRRATDAVWGQSSGRETRYRSRKGDLLKMRHSRKGYLYVRLSLGKLRYDRRISRLVCEIFHGPAPTPEHQAAHGDGNVLN